MGLNLKWLGLGDLSGAGYRGLRRANREEERNLAGGLSPPAK
jgi:hypothetical protein